MSWGVDACKLSVQRHRIRTQLMPQRALAGRPGGSGARRVRGVSSSKKDETCFFAGTPGLNLLAIDFEMSANSTGNGGRFLAGMAGTKGSDGSL